jgi:hypothetical protein
MEFQQLAIAAGWSSGQAGVCQPQRASQLVNQGARRCQPKTSTYILAVVSLLQSVIGLAAFWVVLGGIVGVAGFNYVNSKQIKDQP